MLEMREKFDMQKERTGIFPAKDAKFWKYVYLNMNAIREIRIRVGKPIIISLHQKEVSLDEEGNLLYVPIKGKRFTYQELYELMEYWCMDSRYAFQEEIRRGYLTIPGGHRIGICGEAVDDINGNVRTIKYISGVNIRIAHEKKKAAENIMPYLYEKQNIKNSLIISPPGAGKTTLLRDIVRRISDGNEEHQGKNVGIVDERGEIAACFQGIPQLDIGMRSDVLTNCRKQCGMSMVLRSMAPEVIAVDELGNKEELELIQGMYGSGCAVIATIHGSTLEEVCNKKMFKDIWEEKIFENILILERNEHKFKINLYRFGEETPCYIC